VRGCRKKRVFRVLKERNSRSVMGEKGKKAGKKNVESPSAIRKGLSSNHLGGEERKINLLSHSGERRSTRKFSEGVTKSSAQGGGGPPSPSNLLKKEGERQLFLGAKGKRRVEVAYPEF